MQLQWVDIAIISVIGLSVLTGLFRGFVKELVALFIWILAIWMGYHYAEHFDVLLQPYVQEKSVRTGIAFIGLLFATLLVGGVINTILSFILKRAGLSGTDRTLGMGFGFLRGIFIVALIMVAVKMTSVPSHEYIQKSMLYAQFDPLVSWLSQRMPDLIKQVKTADNNKEIIDTVSTV